MLPKKERLSRKEFSRFFSMGARIHSPVFQVVYTPYPTFHASVVVPKKVARLAVTRNRIRRRVYDILRTYKKTYGITGVYIYLCKQNIDTMAPHALNEEVITILKKINHTP